MKRSLTNRIRFFMDECLPPIIRDNKYLMYPLFHIWYKGKNVRKMMEFKSEMHKIGEKEYEELYGEKHSLSHDRPTDLSHQSIQYIIAQLGADKNQKILDVGCGRGYFLDLLKKEGFTNLYGCDLIDYPKLEGVSYSKENIEKLTYEDHSFDVVIVSHTLEHIPDLDKAVSELKRITKNKIIVTVPCQRYYHYTFDLHIHFFPEESYVCNMMQMENYTCEKINGDWTFIGYNSEAAPAKLANK